MPSSFILSVRYRSAISLTETPANEHRAFMASGAGSALVSGIQFGTAGLPVG
jgi:hypothetical protein